MKIFFFLKKKLGQSFPHFFFFFFRVNKRIKIIVKRKFGVKRKKIQRGKKRDYVIIKILNKKKANHTNVLKKKRHVIK